MPRGQRTRRVVVAEASPVGLLYTTDEVAQLLKVARRTVQSWIRSGKLRARKVGSEYRVEADVLRTFVE